MQMERLQVPSGQLCLRASRYQFDHKSMERLQRLSGQMHIRAKNQFGSGQLTVKHSLTNLKIREGCKVLTKSSNTSVPILGYKGKWSLLTRPLTILILGIANIVIWIAKMVFIISLITGISNLVLEMAKMCEYLVLLYRMPIKKGDIITISGENNEITGFVEDLGFITCTLNTLGGFHFVVPTKTLIFGAYKLNGAESHLKWDFCVPMPRIMTYSNCADKLQSILNEVPRIKRGSPRVLLTEFNSPKQMLTIVVTCLANIESLEGYHLTKEIVLSSVCTAFCEEIIN